MELADWLQKHPVDAEAAKHMEEKWATTKGKEPDVMAAQRKIRDIIRSMPTAAPGGRPENPLMKDSMITLREMRNNAMEDFGKNADALGLTEAAPVEGGAEGEEGADLGVEGEAPAPGGEAPAPPAAAQA